MYYVERSLGQGGRRYFKLDQISRKLVHRSKCLGSSVTPPPPPNGDIHAAAVTPEIHNRGNQTQGNFPLIHKIRDKGIYVVYNLNLRDS